MTLIWSDDEPTDRILQFPPEYSQLPRVSAREIARMKIEEYRRRKAQKVEMDKAGTENRSTGLQSDVCGNGDPQWATGRDRAAETTMRELTPPLVEDDERGKGDSVNAAMHRVLYPKGAA